ncbi:MAG: M36 family metallopeptidase [Lewinella sp.]|nr:M36 family metallopeptidase [Lewinella sp.]
MFNIKNYMLILVLSLPVISSAQLTVPQLKERVRQEWTASGQHIEDLKEISLSSFHTSSLSGITHAYFQQSFAGIPIRNGLGSIHTDQSGKVKFVNLSFYREIEGKVKTTKAGISSKAARNFAAHSTNFPAPEKKATTQAQPDPRLVFIENEKGELILSYEVELPTTPDSDDRFVVWVDAANGRELDRHNRTLYCQFEPEEKHEHIDMPLSINLPETPEQPTSMTALPANPKYFAFPSNIESPLYGNRVLLHGNNIIDPTASPLGWHKNNAGLLSPQLGYTQGNNVYAFYAPLGETNPTPAPITRDPILGLYLQGNVPWPGNLHFNYTQDPNGLLGSQFIEGAVTNLFVRNNFLHDLLFHYGFDEAAGNFQTTNLSGAGEGNDHVLARAQDGLGINQASFSTPPDGENPTMRMFLWDTDLPNSIRDASFDNLIIAHEYTHGLSFRLVGGANNTNCLTNFEQGGEGWSDFVGLMMTLTDKNGNGVLEESVLGEGVRGIGHYVLTKEETEAGLRPRHYTRNMDCNDGLCNEFTYGDLTNLSRPHGVGFLWCTMLWDLSWNLINEYGFEADLYNTNSTAGNIRALKVVIEALKMTPCTPSFIDMRDAVLAANDLIYNGEGNDLLWEAFARRGLGYSAQDGGREAFDDPYMQLIKTVDKTEAEVGEPITYTITLTNHTGYTLSQALISDQLPPNFVATYISNNGSISPDGLVTWPKIDLPQQTTLTRTITGYLDTATRTEVVASYPVEQNNLLGFIPVGLWLPSSDYPNPNTGSGMSWFHLDPPVATESYLMLPMVLDNSLKNYLSFWHAFDVEPGLDGGVVEILVNGEWQDLGNFIIEGEYNNVILDELPTPVGVPVPFNTLSGRRAFSGSSGGYQRTIIDLSIFEGPVSIRFRFASNLSTNPDACDGSTPGCDGWFIDDVEILHLEHLPNTACAYSATTGKYACGDIGALGTIIKPASAATRVRPIAMDQMSGTMDLQIFPNPAQDRATVRLPETGGTEAGELYLLNAQGQVLDRYIIPEGETLQEIDGSRLEKGMYFLSFRCGNQTSVHKIVFQ